MKPATCTPDEREDLASWCREQADFWNDADVWHSIAMLVLGVRDRPAGVHRTIAHDAAERRDLENAAGRERVAHFCVVLAALNAEALESERHLTDEVDNSR